MSDISILTDEEYGRICAAIPHGVIVGYFKKNPKEFSKIRPGFRASAIKMDDAVKLMVKCRQNGFISSFVERIVKDWLAEISDAITEYQKDGETEISASIRALSQSYFADNNSAYFKLAETEFSDDDISLIQATIALVKDYETKVHEIEDKLNKSLQEIDECKRVIINADSKNKRQLEESALQIRKLKERIEELKKAESLYREAQGELEKSKQDIERLNRLNATSVEKMAELQSEIEKITKEKADLEVSVRKKLEDERKEELLAKVFTKPLRPVDIDEFLDYLRFNLESIGVKNESDLPIKDLLSFYIADTVFCGKPIVCDKVMSEVLSGCIANALVGTSDVSRISFTADINEKALREFLINSGRIIVIDNFLGNFNETILFSIIDDYRNKIIILTYSYSKTLKFISEELFAFCNFIGAAKVPALFAGSKTDEDPSTFDEEEYDPEWVYYGNRYETILRNMLKELNYCEKIVNAKVLNISDERKLCEILLFDIIPYCIEVRSINPLNYSRTLQKYMQKSHYSKLLERWLDT